MLTRRDFLRASALGGVAAFLAACGASTESPPPTASRSSPAGGSPTPSPSPAPTATPSVVASPSPASPPPGPSLEEQIAGLLIVGFRGAELAQAAWLERALATGGLGGVILFDRDQITGKARNVISPNQVRRLTDDLRAAAGARRIFVGVDQEGGVVTRLSPAHGFPAVASEATIGAGSTSAARRWASSLAGTLVESGFDLNFAP